MSPTAAAFDGPPTAPDAPRPWIDPAVTARPLILAAGVRAQLASVIAAGYPRETCGALIGLAEDAALRISAAPELPNQQRERAGDRFEIDPADLLACERAAERDGHELLGIWHSHPDHPPLPSASDHERAWDGYAYLIVEVGADGVGRWASWARDEGRFVPQAVRDREVDR